MPSGISTCVVAWLTLAACSQPPLPLPATDAAAVTNDAAANLAETDSTPANGDTTLDAALDTATADLAQDASTTDLAAGDAPDTQTGVLGCGLTVSLTWHTPADPDQTNSGPGVGSDMDLHFALLDKASQPDANCDGNPDPWFGKPWDVFSGNPKPDWGVQGSTLDDPELLVQDTDGAGPESLHYENPLGTAATPVTYAIGIHYWNDHGFGPSSATVSVFWCGTLAWQVPIATLQVGDFWYVGHLTWPVGAKPDVSCKQSGDACKGKAGLPGGGKMWQATGTPCITPK